MNRTECVRSTFYCGQGLRLGRLRRTESDDRHKRVIGSSRSLEYHWRLSQIRTSEAGERIGFVDPLVDGRVSVFTRTRRGVQNSKEGLVLL